MYKQHRGIVYESILGEVDPICDAFIMEIPRVLASKDQKSDKEELAAESTEKQISLCIYDNLYVEKKTRGVI